VAAIPDYNAGSAYLTVLPDLSAFGTKLREELAKDQTSVKVPVEPESDPGKGTKDGEEYGGAFGDAMRARIDAALKDLPKAKIDADSTDADRKIDEIRTRLEELRDKRIGVDISSTEALAEIAAIKAELDELGSKSPNVQVKVDALKAAADLAGVRAEVTALDGKNVDIHVDDNGSASRSAGDINALMLAGISLGPAIIPVAAAVAAALGAIGTGAIAGIAAIGTIKLAFTGISSVIKDMDTAQTSQGQNATQLYAQQVSSANSVASAQDGVRNAIRAVSDAEHAAALASQQAAEQVATAQRGVQDAYIQAGISIKSALEAQTRAEQNLTQAQEQASLAQQSLTAARQAAQRQIESLTLAVEDGALAERQAQLDIQQAKQSLDQTLANPTATTLQRQQAQLGYDQAVQQLKDIQVRNQQNAEDKAAADAKGVNGSDQVQAAQRGVVQATQAVATAQQGVADADSNVTEVRRQNAEKIAQATQALTDAQQNQAEAARSGAESIEKAQEGVVTAQRALTGALAQQAAQQSATSSSASKLAQDMSKLSPAGQEFARFVHDDLEPKVKSLQATAQQGLLPGVETGLRAMFPIFPEINSLVGSVASAIGNLAARTGSALNDPFWRGFISFVQSEAGPTINTFGIIVGNLAHGFAGLLIAFKPVWDQMGQGLVSMTQKFADFGEHAGTNSSFQQFLTYVKTEGPVVVSALGHIVLAFSDMGRALGPLGGLILGVVNSIAQFITGMDPKNLQFFVTTLWLGYEAWKAWQIISTIAQFMKDYRLIELAVAVATGDWTAAQTILNATLLANPIGIIIAIIAALVVGIIYCYTHFQTFRDIVNDVWTVIKAVILDAWTFGIKFVFDQITTSLRVLGDGWNVFLNVIRVVVDGIKIIFDALTGNWQGVVNAFNDGMNALGNIWNRLIDIAKTPVNFVIGTIYNTGIVGVWNGIAGVFGLPQLKPAALLAGGGVIPGYAPGVDNQLAMLSPGEGVLVPEAVRGLGANFVHGANAYFAKGRVTGGPGFADGGVVGAIGNAASGVWSAISGIFTDPVGTVRKVFSSVVADAARIPGTGLLRDALIAIPNKVIDAVIAKAKQLIQTVGSAITGGGSGVEQWRGTGLAALAAEGQSADNITRLLYQMQTESGGNPTIVNTTDINWTRGTPSVGLMQVIGPTYASYKDSRFDTGPYEYGTSVNPMANITSAIRYTLAAYGSLASGWQGHGYDSGGWLPPGITLAHNGTGQAERVLTGPQYAALAGAAQSSGRPIEVNIYPRAEHSEADIADMVSRRLAFTLGAAT
jgi:hypothetical protein